MLAVLSVPHMPTVLESHLISMAAVSQGMRRHLIHDVLSVLSNQRSVSKGVLRCCCFLNCSIAGRRK